MVCEESWNGLDARTYASGALSYNGRAFSFSIPVCIWDLDTARTEWAKAIILDYFERGENDELLDIARKFAPMIEPFEWSPDKA